MIVLYVNVNYCEVWNYDSTDRTCILTENCLFLDDQGCNNCVHGEREGCEKGNVLSWGTMTSLTSPDSSS